MTLLKSVVAFDSVSQVRSLALCVWILFENLYEERFPPAYCFARIESMLPRFSLRMSLLLLSFGGVVCYVLAAASSGQAWAMAIGLGLLSLPVAFLVYFLLAIFTLGLSALRRPNQTPVAAAPTSASPSGPSAQSSTNAKEAV